MNLPIDWLLDGESWVVYRTRRDLLGESEETQQVKTARAAMLEEQKIQKLVSGLSNWPGKVVASHKSAGQPFHTLSFIADLGLNMRDPGIAVIADRIMEHRSDEGPFQLPMQIGSQYGGTGEEIWGWALCDAPTLVYALVKFGFQEDPNVRAAMDHLHGLVRENGWPCAVSKELGNWHGPGRKGDPCPYANLIMLKTLAQVDSLRDTEACRTGAETLLTLWAESMTLHPYIFYMGTDFRKLKMPFIWYDLMHVLDVLSQFSWLQDDLRLMDMAAVLQQKMDPQGCFTPESVWMAWKEWEFGQKKTPSRWLTLAAWRIFKRLNLY
ncbi:MAG: hypothetical protein V2J07_07625 [Anaerolineae bacterium]|jgi:hypothetical protein|nr:hypothetical protein [Anaerolineae bacterium]